MMLMTYAPGLRVSKVTGLRSKDLDLDTARLFVRRHQPRAGCASQHKRLIWAIKSGVRQQRTINASVRPRGVSQVPRKRSE
jgi:integrase